jgi:alpha-amylase
LRSLIETSKTAASRIAVITPDDVVYMIVTDRFADGDPANNDDVDRSDPRKRHGGDLRGIVRRMPYLRDLGVTTLWLSPVYPNPPEAYHGYHPLDFEHVDPHMCSPELGPSGSTEVLRRFVEIAHGEGFKVIFDAIVCHTARGHRWLIDRPDWFNPNSSAPEKWWIWGLPDLNHDRIAVNVYFARNLIEWMATGIDAVRLDAARHVEKPFWRAYKALAKGVHSEVTLIGEVWDGDVAQVAPYQTQHGFDSMFDYPLYHAIVDVFAEDKSFHRIACPEISSDEVRGILNKDDEYRNAGHLMTFIDNHDTQRFFHLAGGPAKPEEAMLRTKLALTFVFTARGIPQLYYGSELAMDGGPDPDNRRDMPWEWAETTEPASASVVRAHEMHRFVRKLIEIRRGSKALRFGLTTTLYVTPSLYAFLRGFPNDARLVVLNNSPNAVDARIPVHANPRLSTLPCCHLREGLRLIDELDQNRTAQICNGEVRIALPGRAGAVLRPLEVGSNENTPCPPR